MPSAFQMPSALGVLLLQSSESFIRPPHGRKPEKGDKHSTGRMTGFMSDFSRLKTVESRLVHKVCSGVRLSASDGRLWVLSSVKWLPRVVGRVSVVVFERGSTTEIIGESVFCKGGLKSIVIPSSVVVFGKWRFSQCRSHEAVIFENNSRLERINESAFRGSGLKLVEIPSSGVVLGRLCFFSCKPLESVIFESDSRLEWIDGRAIYESGLKSIEIQSSVVVLGKGSFRVCESLE
jgi:hypothetical protein